jgi:hypothetical protein
MSNSPLKSVSAIILDIFNAERGGGGTREVHSSLRNKLGKQRDSGLGLDPLIFCFGRQVSQMWLVGFGWAKVIV